MSDSPIPRWNGIYRTPAPKPRTRSGRFLVGQGVPAWQVSDVEAEAAEPAALDVERLRIAYEAGRAAADFEATLDRINETVTTADTAELLARLQSLDR